MKILIIIVLALILALFALKIKINIQRLSKHKKSFKIDFDINMAIYLFDFIKIFSISFKQDGIKFLIFKFSYNKIKINKNKMRNIKKDLVIKIFKNLKIENLNLNIVLGTENMSITVFSIFVVSALLSILPLVKKEQIDTKKYNYNIVPAYNENVLNFDISAKFSIRLLQLLKILFKKRKNEFSKKLTNEPVKV